MCEEEEEGTVKFKMSAKNCQEKRRSVMVFAGFLLNGPGPIIRITETTNDQSYLKHLQDHLVPHAKIKIDRSYHLLFDKCSFP